MACGGFVIGGCILLLSFWRLYSLQSFRDKLYICFHCGLQYFRCYFQLRLGSNSSLPHVSLFTALMETLHGNPVPNMLTNANHAVYFKVLEEYLLTSPVHLYLHTLLMRDLASSKVDNEGWCLLNIIVYQSLFEWYVSLFFCKLIAQSPLWIACRSLVNCITANSSSRVSLNSCRNAFSMVSLFVAWPYYLFWLAIALVTHCVL